MFRRLVFRLSASNCLGTARIVCIQTLCCLPSSPALSDTCLLQEERTGEPLDPEIQWMMEGGPGLRPDGSDNFHGLWDCDEASGVGERHVKMMPRAPHYEVSSRAADKLAWCT